MAYMIGFQIPPAPTDNQQAFEQFDTLAESVTIEEEPHPIFIKVHSELTNKYPCLCDLPEDRIDDGIWSDGPLIDNFGQQAAVLGIMFSKVEASVPYVFDVGLKHGVTMFDWQTGIVHRPNS